MVILVVFVAFFGTILLVVGLSAYLLTCGIHRSTLRISAGLIGGWLAGALFVWSLVPRDWPLSIWKTLQATVDDATYGHRLEHAAEGIVIWMLAVAVVGAASGGLAACVSRRRA